MNKPDKTYKRIFVLFVLLIVLITIVGLLTACETYPILDERCYDDYENFTFYEIERDGPLGSTETAYMFETPHGDIEVSKKIYENAMEYEYAEICYDREDGTATSYLYTKKGQGLAPEPEIIMEYVDREVEVEVPVYTHTVVESFLLGGVPPTVGYPLEGVAWIGLRIDEEDLYLVSGGEEPTSERIHPNFDTGDTVLIVIFFDKNIVADDEVWIAQYIHIRSGIVLESIILPEVWEPTTFPNLEDFVNAELEDISINGQEATLQNAYNSLYPAVTE